MSGRVVHVPDIAALEDYHEGDRSLVSGVKLGMATALFVPMLKNDDVIACYLAGAGGALHGQTD
jgi:hypothetical protein